MAQQSYTIRASRTGVGGLRELLVSVFKTSALDTVDFSADLAKVTAAAVVADTRNAPAISTANLGLATTVVTLQAGTNYVNDDVDLFVIGPALS